jgi:pyruvate formate lyase activating enzyme
MKIAGLQKISTIDYPGEIAATVFLHGCNFRCGFCYNPDLVVGECEGSFSEEGFFEFLKRRVGKLDAVCITGGEPLISLDFGFVRKIKDMGFKVKLDTNGSFPERLREIVDLGLVDYIAMDIKGAREDYEDIVGVKVDLEKIEESIKIVNDFDRGVGVSGCRGVGGSSRGEFRTTVVDGLHDSEKLVKMGEWMGLVCGGKPGKIFLQGFKVAKDGMIDSSFMGKSDFLEGDLERLKEDMSELFGEIGIRC